MEIVYPDYNCFQRFADDPSQVRIVIEALACEELFARAALGDLQLVWSFVHEDEAERCPFPERRAASLLLAAVCTISVRPDPDLRDRARELQLRCGLSSPDALHLACALCAGAGFLVTCDDEFIRRAGRTQASTVVLDPVDYILGEERRWRNIGGSQMTS